MITKNTQNKPLDFETYDYSCIEQYNKDSVEIYADKADLLNDLGFSMVININLLSGGELCLLNGIIKR